MVTERLKLMTGVLGRKAEARTSVADHSAMNGDLRAGSAVRSASEIQAAY
jgi:hypothetical protein